MSAPIHQPTARAIRSLAALLRRGGLVAIPTETVYGLAANALDARACRGIFRAKKRPANDPLIVHVTDLKAAEKLAAFSEPARILARRFWPGPLTLVLPRTDAIPDLVTSGQATVALRAPAHLVARRLLRAARIPLAAPSANLFGYISPTTAEHVRAGLGNRIDAILDGGPCPVGIESTIAEVTSDGGIRILRPGAISGADLRAALRKAGIRGRLIRRPSKRVMLTPGALDQHYSPRTPLEICAKITPNLADTQPSLGGSAYIYRRKPRGRNRSDVFFFSRTGSAREVARHFYRVLREADAAGFRKIVAESMPERKGDALAAAINDRLARAAGRRPGI